MRLVEAYGLVHQPPSFVVPVPGLTPATLEDGLQRAVQASSGAEIDLPDETTLTASVFHNAFYNMTDALSSISALQGGIFRGIEQRATGEAIGLELFARRSLAARLGGFVSYTLSRSMRSLPNATFPSAFDRTHVASAALAYDLGKRWRAGARIVFYTGVPKTLPPRGLIVPPSVPPPGARSGFLPPRSTTRETLAHRLARLPEPRLRGAQLDPEQGGRSRRRPSVR